jgi:hypothetical protein
MATSRPQPGPPRGLWPAPAWPRKPRIGRGWPPGGPRPGRAMTPRPRARPSAFGRRGPAPAELETVLTMRMSGGLITVCNIPAPPSITIDKAAAGRRGGRRRAGPRAALSDGGGDSRRHRPAGIPAARGIGNRRFPRPAAAVQPRAAGLRSDHGPGQDRLQAPPPVRRTGREDLCPARPRAGEELFLPLGPRHLWLDRRPAPRPGGAGPGRGEPRPGPRLWREPAGPR